jgi:HPt (histidine-containing phosphotransfer) domain-containing protein
MGENVLDLKEFLERVQEDKDLLLELLDIYVADYQQKRQTLEVVLKDNNFEEIRNIAHSLKGASGNISAKDLRELFYRIENMGKNKTPGDVPSLIIEMDTKFAELLKRIEDVKKELQ